MAKYNIKIAYRKHSMTNILIHCIEVESNENDIERIAQNIYNNFMERDSFGYEIYKQGYAICKAK